MNSITRTLLLLLVLIGTGVQASAPDTLAFLPALVQLKTSGDSLLKGSSDSVRRASHEQFLKLADSVLRNPASYTLSFAQVPAFSVVTAPDHSFRILTWMLQESEGNKYSYYGYVQVRDEKKKTIRTVRLYEEAHNNNDSAEYFRLDSSNWMGCIYYKVIQERVDKKNYYLLLGWAPHSFLTTRKIAEPFQITPTKVLFGAPIIRGQGRTRCRLVFEYNSRVTMSLRYEEKMKMVVFDHIQSSDPRPESKGMYSMYGPDMTYDGLKFSNGTWVYQKDIQVNNQVDTDGKTPKVEKLRVTRKIRQ